MSNPFSSWEIFRNHREYPRAIQWFCSISLTLFLASFGCLRGNDSCVFGYNEAAACYLILFVYMAFLTANMITNLHIIAERLR